MMTGVAKRNGVRGALMHCQDRRCAARMQTKAAPWAPVGVTRTSLRIPKGPLCFNKSGPQGALGGTKCLHRAAIGSPKQTLFLEAF